MKLRKRPNRGKSKPTKVRDVNGDDIQNQATSSKQEDMPTVNKELRRQQKFGNL